MHAESQRKETSTTGSTPRPASRHKLPDPPDPDNLPIDYRAAGWDSQRNPSAVPKSPEPKHPSHRRSA
ncbi:hypothetical protein J3D46_001236 [Paenarthrobacter sp. A20]|nr:hypothetical protein [Paenarthrobacter sp. A20]